MEIIKREQSVKETLGFSNYKEPKVFVRANNGIAVDEIVKYDDLMKAEPNAQIKYMDELDKHENAEPYLVHVKQNKNGENKEYSLHAFKYNKVRYDYKINNNHDKLEFLAQLGIHGNDFQTIDDETCIIRKMLVDWFGQPTREHFKDAAQLVLNANKDTNPTRVSLQESSINGLDILHVYYNNIHVAVDAFYDGKFKVYVFNENSKDNNPIDESMKNDNKAYTSEFLKKYVK